MAGTITALSVQQGNKSRVNVFLDGEFAFGLSLNQAAALKKGQLLTDADIAGLRHADEAQQAYERAVRYLGRRPRSRVEVERYLQNKRFAEPAIEAAVARLLDQGYLDDKAFSQFWTENRLRFRPRGTTALRYELRQKGVDSEMIEAALEDLDEDEVAWNAVEPRLARWRDLPQDEFEQKLGAYLARRGFNYSTIKTTGKRAWDKISDEQADDRDDAQT